MSKLPLTLIRERSLESNLLDVIGNSAAKRFDSALVSPTALDSKQPADDWVEWREPPPSDSLRETLSCAADGAFGHRTRILFLEALDLLVDLVVAIRQLLSLVAKSTDLLSQVLNFTRQLPTTGAALLGRCLAFVG